MFGPHGSFQLELKGNYLRVDACGPFNEEAVQNYYDQLRVLAPLLPDTWGQLNVMHDNCLYTPQAERELVALTTLRLEQGLHWIAFVIPDMGKKMTMHQRLARVYCKLEIKHAFYEKEDEAVEWLRVQYSEFKKQSN